MPIQSWQQLIDPGATVTDSTALTNTVTPTSILHANSKVGFYANFWRVGKRVRVYAAGRISTLNPTPGNLTFDLRVGPASPPTIVCANGGAIALNTVIAKTNVPWRLEWDLTCRTVGNGTSATLMHNGYWQSEAIIGSAAPAAGGQGVMMIPVGAPAVGTGFDSTVSLFFDLFGTWSVASASNSILTHAFHVEELN